MRDQTTEPDNPAAAAIVAKAKRLMLLTLGLTFIALAVVLTVIGYRVLNLGERTPPREAVLQLPPGAKVLSSSVADGRIAVTVQTAMGVEILIFEANSLKEINRLRLGSPP
jgi:hypothetical protein